MHRPTLDPDVFIETSHNGYVRYVNCLGIRWEVRGVCNQCGLCVVGAAHPEHYEWRGSPGTPYAVVDLRVAQGRLDEPITADFPAKMPSCTLTAGLL